MIRDDTGDNISKYIDFFHYRRYLNLTGYNINSLNNNENFEKVFG